MRGLASRLSGPSGAYGYLKENPLRVDSESYITRKLGQYAELLAVTPSIHPASLLEWQAAEFDHVMAGKLETERFVEARCNEARRFVDKMCNKTWKPRDKSGARSLFEPSTYITD